ncbi:hypothetical protein ETH_00010675 [Eimeria tenella]|uniref:carbonic anhydrase n=1 Tax=Eimeria tenella TaxID=5802 RepID=U6LB52_EIMTE|nr:hypothetical protein ETH_00010675 [Eimeria tenella]CDJ44970.1 hypothetical protein ETH_00010675 [Eimeria tenella]|eukprot:XP_013235717.1 hypothetical protein ETH_00010675 [Eimeria tenella]
MSLKRQSPIEVDAAALQRLVDHCCSSSSSGSAAAAEEVAATGNLLKVAPAEMRLGNELAAAAAAAAKQVVFDWGLKLQLKPAAAGDFGSLAAAANKYEVQQFHFHAPAEHTLGGRSSIELHVVCKCTDTAAAAAAANQNLVLGIFFEAKEGAADNPFLLCCERALAEQQQQQEQQEVPAAVREALQQAAAAAAADDSSKDTVNLKELIDEDKILVTYEGSLTTPPCTENVLWYLRREAIPTSPEQAKRFSLYLKRGEGAQARSNYRLRQNVEVKANDQTLYVWIPELQQKTE